MAKQRRGFSEDLYPEQAPILAIPGEAAQTLTNRTGQAISDFAGAAQPVISEVVQKIVEFPAFQLEYIENLCFRKVVNGLYRTILLERSETAPKWDYWGPLGRSKSELQEKSKEITDAGLFIFAAEQVYRKKFNEAQQGFAGCIGKNEAQEKIAVPKSTITTAEVDPSKLIKPFDRRMDRLFLNSDGDLLPRIPFDTSHQQASTVGFSMTEKTIRERNAKMQEDEDLIKSVAGNRRKMRQDDFYIGLPSIINTYSITRLYGSKGGEFLLDQKGERAWYEIDQSQNDTLAFSKNPNLSTIIDWGNKDPYGRTPYHFTDFAFCKYWDIIPNNRLITLRRFAAPIYDNMKFPGMDGLKDDGAASKTGANDPNIIGDNGVSKAQGTTTSGADTAAEEGGSGKKVIFPPMATAVTYFGEETGNKVSELLKFTSGFNWGETEADLWTVSPESDPNADAGAGGLFGGLTKYSKMLNIGTGNFDHQGIMNKGNIPPDPYSEGPYENRIIGPVNRITKVRKREAGLQFENTIALTFEYSARPIGGVNPKAALLDILSNFLVIGSASAVFWGGQHRFMGRPINYPFLGGDKGIQQWYRGDPVGWAGTTMKEFTGNAKSLFESAGDFLKNLFGGKSGGDFFGGLKNLLSGDNVAGNAIKAYAAEKSSGQIPYLQGMKALLIGEPIGEWHVTMGNPLNPMAMMGNLICDHIEVEFNDELGPDDFPTELKVVVHLEHGMARDRDSIQSIFNRGMGRIYELPDDVKGSADYETAVDKYTKDNKKYSEAGRNPDWFNVPIGDSGTTYGKWGRAAQTPNALGENISVWNRPKFQSISGTENLDLSLGKIDHKSQFRAAEWVYLKSLRG